MRVAGIMSGTSLDGIDVAIVDLSERNRQLRIKTIAFTNTPYRPAVRRQIFKISNTNTHTADISRMNFLLGELYAEALIRTCAQHRIPIESIQLCGMHGQTIFHESSPVDFLGHPVASTLQIGEAAIVAERTGISTISNFRERDIAAGGHGAPLVPFVDYALLRHPHIHRVALNIGGIANITILPADASPEQIVAFDTGPGNMVLDALAAVHTRNLQSFDADGALARTGTINKTRLKTLLRDPYFRRKPPKTCGREQFGQEFVARLIATGLPTPDLLATATEFTARSIAEAIRRYAPATRELIASGGGIHNTFLMERLAAWLPNVEVTTTATHGIDPDAKEAIAFAILAYEHAKGRPANLPSATGSRRAVLLGKSTPGSAGAKPRRHQTSHRIHVPQD